MSVLMMRRMLAGIGLTAALLAAPPPAASAAPEEERGPVIGSEAPGFALESLDGEEVSLASFRGEAPVVLVFFRGAW